MTAVDTTPVDAPALPALTPWQPPILSVMLWALAIAITVTSHALAVRADTTVPAVLAAAAVSFAVGWALNVIGKHHAGHHVNRIFIAAAYVTLAAAFVLLFAAFAVTGGGSR